MPEASETSTKSNHKTMPTSIPDDLQSDIRQKQRTAIPTQIIPSNVSLEQEFRPVDVSKLKKIPAEHTQGTGVALGVFEQLVHGVLYIFWQLKRQVDLVSYLVERICAWRKPLEDEKDEINILSRHSDGLEFFQDFYAAFLAIIIQLCRQFKELTLLGSDKLPKLDKSKAVTTVFVETSSSTTIGLPSSSDPATLGKESKSLLWIFAASSEVIVSTLVIWSLLVAVRRRDDGILSLLLSTIGWGCIFFSRLFIFSLTYSEFGPLLTLTFLFIHVIGMTAWIYRIAKDSHNEKEHERQDKQWNDLELECRDKQTATPNETKPIPNNNPTDYWTNAEHASLLSQIFFLFAIPSLFYWPFMFNLKLNYRPYKYMALILTENFSLIMSLILFANIERSTTVNNGFLSQTTMTASFNILNVLVPVAVASIVGFTFLCLYLLCKPSLTEYFAHADSLFNESKQSGIYYEFCSRVFKMPDFDSHRFRRLMRQEEEVVSIETL